MELYDREEDVSRETQGKQYGQKQGDLSIFACSWVSMIAYRTNEMRFLSWTEGEQQ